MRETDFKKWGWWAIGGIVVVALGAVLIVGLTAGPKATQETDGGETVAAVDEGPEEESKPVVDEGLDMNDTVVADTGKPAAVDTLPQTGPAESNGVLLLVLLGVGAYVGSLAVARLRAVAVRSRD